MTLSVIAINCTHNPTILIVEVTLVIRGTSFPDSSPTMVMVQNQSTVIVAAFPGVTPTSLIPGEQVQLVLN